MTLEESNLKLSGSIMMTTVADETESWSGNIAILFDYISEESNSVEASITDNWVESNYTLQDHIAIKPRIYRLKGYVGEVVFKQPKKVMTELSYWYKSADPILVATRKAMQPITALSGIVSNYTRSAINIVNQLESSYDRYKQVYDAFMNKNQEFIGRRQKTVSSLLLNILETRTPVKIFDLMFDDIEEIKGRENRLYFLQSVSARQGDNGFISDYEVTIKEFRIATSQITKANYDNYANAPEKTVQANNGKSNTITLKPVAGKLRKIMDDPNAQMSRIIGNDIKQVVSGSGQNTKIFTIQDTGFSSKIINVTSAN